ncbi:ElaA protein [Vibrio nigripulchritudo]|uniref:GNAT family N-acetyltransferase n=1 Tax=Vibrio nigripulchritudo TaxID=28173 RepID=UPI00190CF2B4|nr:GNAT family N-acetyltransferase [Vibrio nigripulchritudo]BCL68405.1 ElaA protein [Vibrio nigripulchritudo]BDU29733.1 ElaA protein [Vibrio nigripulchritudo]
MANWQLHSFDQLSNIQLYQMLKLRVDVFVVEQDCPYPELDDKDHLDGVYHLLGYEGEELVACARLIARGISYPETTSIGRVVTKESARGHGLGHELMEQAVTHLEMQWGKVAIKISAQQHLSDYYNRHGFAQCTEMYLEDGIPHIGMIREPK